MTTRMMTTLDTPEECRRSRRPGLAVALLAALLLIGPSSVRAGFIVAVPTDLKVSPGGSGSFDVMLKDTDPVGSAPILVAGVQLELRVGASSGIAFSDANTSTGSTYIFAGNSFDDANGIPLATSSFPTSDLTTLDQVKTANSFTSVGPGDTFDLAHVSFSAAVGATPGTVPISVVVYDPSNEPSGTLLSNPDGVSIPFQTQDGAITINAVPEPSSLALMGIAGSLLLAGNALRRRRPAFA